MRADADRDGEDIHVDQSVVDSLSNVGVQRAETVELTQKDGGLGTTPARGRDAEPSTTRNPATDESILLDKAALLLSGSFPALHCPCSTVWRCPCCPVHATCPLCGLAVGPLG